MQVHAVRPRFSGLLAAAAVARAAERMKLSKTVLLLRREASVRVALQRLIAFGDNRSLGMGALGWESRQRRMMSRAGNGADLQAPRLIYGERWSSSHEGMR
jgi:hypothetical protein